MYAARLVLAAVLFTSLAACPLARSAKPDSDHNKASAKSSRDVAACEKMCEVAGDAEDNKAAVAKCKKKCEG